MDGAVRIAAADRAGRERLLRYCARPPLALDRLRELDPERLLYESNKQGPGGNGPQILTPLELLAVTALALAAATTSPPVPNPQPAAEPAHRRATRYARARLLARIYAVFPLVCPLCGAEMRIIAFLTDPVAVRAILAHLGEPTAPPRIAPARGPPLWDLPDAGAGTFAARRGALGASYFTESAKVKPLR